MTVVDVDLFTLVTTYRLKCREKTLFCVSVQVSDDLWITGGDINQKTVVLSHHNTGEQVKFYKDWKAQFIALLLVFVPVFLLYFVQFIIFFFSCQLWSVEKLVIVFVVFVPQEPEKNTFFQWDFEGLSLVWFLTEK